MLPNALQPNETDHVPVLAEEVRALLGVRPGDVVAKSPADGGLPPFELDGLLGRRLVNALHADEDITLEDVEPAGELAARGAQQA